MDAIVGEVPNRFWSNPVYEQGVYSDTGPRGLDPLVDA